MKRKKPTFGERTADLVARWGGSWNFIFWFTLFLAVWVAFNVYSHKAFDPYPFIFLNLFLSCFSCYQAPIILQSQNRQAQIDRERDDDDYKKDVHTNILVRDMHKNQKKILAILEKMTEEEV